MTRWGLPLLAGLAALLPLWVGALPVPVALRITFAFVALVIVPGLLLLRLLRREPPGGAALASGWALGLGLAWLGLHVLAVRFSGGANALVAPLASCSVLALGAAAAIVRPPREPQGDTGLGRLATLLVAAAAIWAAVHVAHHGPALNVYTDSPDHIGTIRRIMASGDAFPRDAFFRDAGPGGADPRKGLWHPEVAVLAQVAHADPIVAWQVLAALLVPLLVLNTAAFCFLLAGARGAGLGAFAVLLAYGGGLGAPYLGEAVFATKLADQLALATLTAVLADLERPGWAGRWTAGLLALGAVFTHVFAAVHLAIVLSALGLALLLRDRAVRGEFARLAGDCLTMAVLTLPFLLWRAHGAYAPSNVIHTEPQGMLYLGAGLRVVSPGVLWDWMGRTWWLWPACTPWLLSQPRSTPRLMLGAAAIAVAVLLFVPPIPQWLQPRLGYLPMRFVWLLPTAGLAALVVDAIAGGLRRGPRRLGAAACALGVLWLFVPSLTDAARDLAGAGAGRSTEATRDMARWRPSLLRLERALPAGAVVLCDPATSYAIPMTTCLYVVTLVDQHSSPNDSLALTRILDARDALDPDGGWARTADVIRHYRVDAIVLNGRFGRAPRLDYWTADADWFRRARARFDARPDAFPVLFDEGDLVAYGVRAGIADTLQGTARRPAFVRPIDPARDRRLGAARPGLPELVGARLFRDIAAPGDTLRVALAWHAAATLPAGSYEVSLRFDRARDARSAPGWLGKPGRKLLERWRHERYRFREDHLPVEGALGVDRWQTGQVIMDTTRVVVPLDAAPGTWRAEVRMHRQPHYPNLDWTDYVSDRDYFSGDSIGTLHIVAAGPSRRARPS